MSKRKFRPSSSAASNQPDYPTLDHFDQSRRRFLTRLGAAFVGAGTLAAFGCGDRPLFETPDAGEPGPAGAAPLPDGRIDQRIQQQDGDDDHQVEGGVAPSPDARIDQRINPPHPGEAPQPDARIDQKDMEILGGVAPMPDAEIDKKDWGPPQGVSPVMDARVDNGGSCPNP